MADTNISDNNMLIGLPEDPVHAVDGDHPLDGNLRPHHPVAQQQVADNTGAPRGRESYLAAFVRQAQQHQAMLSGRATHSISPDPEDPQGEQSTGDRDQYVTEDQPQASFIPIGHRDILDVNQDLDLPAYEARPAPGPDRPTPPALLQQVDEPYHVRPRRAEPRSASAPLLSSERDPTRCITPGAIRAATPRTRPTPSAAMGRPPPADRSDQAATVTYPPSDRPPTPAYVTQVGTIPPAIPPSTTVTAGPHAGVLWNDAAYEIMRPLSAAWFHG